MKEFFEWVRAIIVSIVIALLITFFIRPTIVSGASMEPTFESGDYLIIEKMSYKTNTPKTLDIIVFKSELEDGSGKKKDLIKRVIGVPGDHIVIDSGIVFVNEKPLSEGYLDESFTGGIIDVVVPEDHVFVLGDNRDVSIDSRRDEVGMVPMDHIRGKIWLKVLPLDEFGLIEE